MDMRILEVAIGLLLVVAITTLMVSVLHELWSSLRKQRGDSWFLGVCSLLGDDQVTVGEFRRRFMSSKQPSQFTKAVMAHPLLVSQTLGGAGTTKTPSYLGSDVFVSALLDQLSSMYTSGVRTTTPREWINTVKASVAATPAPNTTARPHASLVLVLETLTHGVADDWPTYEQRVRAWYDSVMVRAAGWFKRDTQLRLAVIGFLLAAACNINPLVIGPRLWNDPPLRATLNGLASQAVKEYAEYTAPQASAPGAKASAPTVAPAPEPRKAAKAAATASAARLSLAPTPESLETDQMLQAVSDALTILAADSRTKSTSTTDANLPENLRTSLWNLQKQIDLRRVAALDEKAASKVFDGSVIIEKQLDALAALGASLDGWKGLASRLEAAVRSERDSLLPSNALGKRGATALSAAQVSNVCVGDVDEATQRLCEPLAAMQSLAGSALPIGWSWANWPGCDGACQFRQRRAAAGTETPLTVKDEYAVLLFNSRSGCQGIDSKLCESVAKGGKPGAEKPVSAVELRSFYARSREIVAQAMTERRPGSTSMAALTSADAAQGVLYAIFGWLIVGFAACLGAPFWFDLLARFVKMRGSGAPSPTGGAEGDSGGKTPPPPPDTMARPAPTPNGPSGSGAGVASPATSAAELGAVGPAELELTAPQIIRIQNGVNITGAGATGRFDADTRTAVVAWQVASKQAVADGILTAAQIGALLAAVAPPAAPVAGGAVRTNMPRRANGTITVLTESELRAAYGDIATVPLPKGKVQVVRQGLPGMPQRTLVPFTHVALPAGTPHLLVHALALPHFTAAFDDIQAQGLQAQIVECAGTLSERHIGSKPEKPLSRHTWGIAIDINSTANPLGAAPVPLGQPGSVLGLVKCFQDAGFAWGGDFTTGVDAMHFELALRDPSKPPLP